MDTFAPTSADQVTELVTASIANEAPLAVGGNATKAGLGRPVEAAHTLSTRDLRGIHFYEPSELVVSAGPGTTMRELKDLLDQHGQELAFEPIDYGLIYRTEPLSGTIGGMVAVNAAGPRRIKAGAARDHLLGFTAVSGRGEVFQSGGRVMKNVTGYDLSKLMTGSFGTLGVFTDLTLKVLPKAEMEETLVIHGLDDAKAIEVMTTASGLPHEVSSFAHLPADIAGRLPAATGASRALTAFRLEGPEVSVTKRRQDLVEQFKDCGGEFATLTPAASAELWQAVRDCAPLANLKADLWRLSVTPTEGANVAETIKRAGVDAKAYYDWAGGLIWLATTKPAVTAATPIRSAISAAGGGHATLIRASAAARREVDVFEPQPAALAALTARIKNGFDPERILNRGRMRRDL